MTDPSPLPSARSSSAEAPLAGARVLVTRMSGQGGRLRRELQDLGADVVAVPTIAVEDPSDSGASLRGLLAEIPTAAWIVLTSPNAADRVFNPAAPDSVDPQTLTESVQIAAVGPGTRDRLAALGVSTDFVPPRAIAESLVEHFPAVVANPVVLLPQAEVSRPTVAEGLTAAGWTVRTAAAYKTVDAVISEDQIAEVTACNAVTFTSGSTVDRFVKLIGADLTPSFVACIGPITASAAADHSMDVDVVAEEHTIDGLVQAIAAQWPGHTID